MSDLKVIAIQDLIKYNALFSMCDGVAKITMPVGSVTNCIYDRRHPWAKAQNALEVNDITMGCLRANGIRFDVFNWDEYCKNNFVWAR